MITSVPVTWNVEDFHNLNYKTDVIDEIDTYLDAGHHPEAARIHNYFEPNPMPQGVDNVKKYFNFLEHCTLAINLLPSGEYVPMHSDTYEVWMKVFNVTNIERIFRSVIMVEDRRFGQFNEVGDEVVSKWKAGDCISWLSTARHSAYNFSTLPRYAIQVTGLLKTQD
jgi:hypothetical protein